MHAEDLVLEPEKLLKECNIMEADNVADFGCGPGIFSIPLARLTKGTVFCFDVMESALEAVKNRAQVMGLHNIVTRRSNLEKVQGSGLDDASINHVVMRKILLQNEDKMALFVESRRVLKIGGNLLVVGWGEDVIKGFGMEKRIPPEAVVAFADQAGFSHTLELDAGRYHYAFIFTK
ncbi:MAG: class I SAM-dependent methyltransferase [Parcubacteria group bacterium]|jgi:ubiquinone/menaquinone biosynthesis C-methylase UbiE